MGEAEAFTLVSAYSMHKCTEPSGNGTHPTFVAEDLLEILSFIVVAGLFLI